LVVITAVVGVFVSEICTSAFCTAIAATPNIPAVTASTGSASRRGLATTQTARKAIKKNSCSNGRGVETSVRSRPPASKRVRKRISMKTGTDRM
jgi:hypothetical protein